MYLYKNHHKIQILKASCFIVEIIVADTPAMTGAVAKCGGLKLRGVPVSRIGVSRIGVSRIVPNRTGLCFERYFY